MCKCEYVNCNGKATKRVISAELEITEGKSAGEGYFCSNHAYEMVESAADTITDINNVDNLKVFHINEGFICASSLEKAVNHYKNEYSNFPEDEEMDIKQCDLIEEGVYLDCTLEYLTETIQNLKDYQTIQISKSNDIYYIFTPFKDAIQEYIEDNQIKDIENTSFAIAWEDY